jgi:hypothetical protein
MPYDKPSCTLNQIDCAGKCIFDAKQPNKDRADAAISIWEWRAAHSYPLNALHMTLRNRSMRVDKGGLTAQRLKRLDSILRKLRRQPTMQMSQMQDIGRCRAVVSNMTRLNMLRFVYQTNPLRHSLIRTRDYIEDPKDDGYRSVHLMYRFSGNASSVPWHRLRIEIQLRTKLQHAWATAVETVDAFTGQDLKFGGGESEWRRFFQLMGALHARLEKTSAIPSTPQSEEALLKEIRESEASLRVISCLSDCTSITEHITKQRAPNREWYLVQMMPERATVYVKGYAFGEFDLARTDLEIAEQQFEGTKNQAVLVRTNSRKELRRAYPNYFADTKYFTSVLQKFLSR